MINFKKIATFSVMAYCVSVGAVTAAAPDPLAQDAVFNQTQALIARLRAVPLAAEMIDLLERVNNERHASLVLNHSLTTQTITQPQRRELGKYLEGRRPNLTGPSGQRHQNPEEPKNNLHPVGLGALDTIRDILHAARGALGGGSAPAAVGGGGGHADGDDEEIVDDPADGGSGAGDPSRSSGGGDSGGAAKKE